MNLGGSMALRTVRLTLVGAACLLGAQLLRAGEPIRFSGRVGPPVTPQEFDQREPLLPAEARSGGKGLTRPELPMDNLLPGQSMTPTTGLTRKQAEALDQKRNWLYQSPDAILKQSTRRDDDPQGPEEREDEQPKSAAERFLEEGDGKAKGADKLRDNDPVQRQLRERKEAEDRNDRNSRTPQDRTGKAKGDENTTGLELRNSPRGTEERYLFNMGDARTTSLVSEARDRERQRERDASLESFRRTFNNPWAQNTPANGGNVLAPGSFGVPAATTMGLPGADLRRPGGFGSFNGFNGGPRPATDFGPRAGLGDFDAKHPLNYGAPGPGLRPLDAPRPTPKPIVLEAPKRKF